ncbi:hypothetical protein C8J56DRAFT_556532 [Mycena floridula]|nr:hypothetical protein C8J56DRAFT_556532 [Mycena floridula]
MASSPSVQRAQTTPSTSGPALNPSRSREWTRNGEPASASAFSGISRGRGRGAPRGARGGRGGRGGGTRGRGGPTTDNVTEQSPSVEQTTPNLPKQSPSTLAKPSPSPVVTVSSSPAEKRLVPPSTTPSTSKKPASRRVSRSIPPVVVPTATVSTLEVPVPSAGRPSNRRKRSQNPKTPNSRANAPPALEESLLNTVKTKGKPAPLSAISRDVPPHLASPFDIGTDIDALVERVRAVAMAENRPTTPGSHIDWAGDDEDDDSLPDLDDWGVKASPTKKEKDEMISPIIVDGLRALPDPVIKLDVPEIESQRTLRGKSQRSSPSDGKNAHSVESKPISNAGEQQRKPQVHPLPPKPVMNEAPVPVKSRGATPMRATFPRSPRADQPSSAGVSTAPASSSPETKKPQIEEPANDRPSQQVAQKPFSAPSDVTQYSTFGSEYTPTHNRSQTLGRPEIPFNSRFSRSGSSTPRGSSFSAGHHSRTHSTPPTGNNRTPHARPVISGDALARISRSLGGPSTPQAKSTVTAIPATIS